MLRILRKKKPQRYFLLAISLSFLAGIVLIFYVDDKPGTSFFNNESLNYKKFRKSIQSNLQVFNNISWGDFLAKDNDGTKRNSSFVMKYRDDDRKAVNKSSLIVNYNVHIFYYPWYGTPKIDGKYYHWNHPYLPHWDKKENKKWPNGSHVPPHDIGANFYPKLGPYSSKDPMVLDQHMKWIQMSGAGVVSVSWYPPDDADNEGKEPDQLVPAIMDAANKYKLKVNFHIEPYKNRNPATLRTNVQYILKKYGKHPAFYRHYIKSKKKHLPLFYIYDSYQTAASEWAKLFKPGKSGSIRNTDLDGIFIALLVERQHKEDIFKSGFDGFYTYFASDTFTYGSSWRNWREIQKFARTRNMVFIPSVGPGYIDTRVRAWNGRNIHDRQDGNYYISYLRAALDVGCSFLSVTSFNEWHEGTQVEPAIPKSDSANKYSYLNYGKESPEFYLHLTKKYVMKIGTAEK
ncbi:hypothetical protein FSP39_006598 [Pinctada imbricata]|uniref:Glycoprotein endo-alpha-1,2-mannosidase n=1 Tax=Pinctada imbricata TaxID=66713 RepID=A0AA89BWM8_PINIB|nr:hypothetical protein FSP39_006598 [Pinctada imbricata]